MTSISRKNITLIKSNKTKAKLYPYLFLLVCFFTINANVNAGEKSYISTEKAEGYFALAEAGKPVPLFVSSDDHAGVIRVLNHLRDDIKMVTGTEPVVIKDEIPQAKKIIIVGSVDKSPLITELAEKG